MGKYGHQCNPVSAVFEGGGQLRIVSYGSW